MESSARRKAIAICVGAIAILAVASAYLVLMMEDEEPDYRDPVYIKGDADFAEEDCVSQGDGSESNPYVIEGLKIGTHDLSRTGITMTGTQAHVLIRDLEICALDDAWPSHTGIVLHNSHNCTMQNITFTGFMTGISIQPRHTVSQGFMIGNLSVTACEFVDCLYGISIIPEDVGYYEVDINITENAFRNTYPCVYAMRISAIDIEDNLMEGNTEGSIYLKECRDCTIKGNSIGGGEDSAIRIYDSSRITVSGNSGIAGATGVVMSSSDNITIEYNNMSSDSGIILRDSQDVLIRFNRIFAIDWERPDVHLIGIFLESSLRVEVSNNSMKDCSVGLLVIDCEEWTASSNTFFRVGLEELVASS